MFKQTKKLLMTLLCVGCCMTAGAGVASYTDKASANDSETFKVVDGAKVRLMEEDEEFGFNGVVVEDGELEWRLEGGLLVMMKAWI